MKILSNCLEILNEDFRSEAKETLKKDENPYLDYFFKNTDDVNKLFTHGLERLPEAGKVDKMLATYFLFLSECKELHDTARSFALDLMVLSEEDEVTLGEYVELKKSDIVNKYNTTIKPLITRRGDGQYH